MPAARANSITASRVMPSSMPDSSEGVSSTAVADEEDVVAGALGHFALVVEHQGLDAAGLLPLDLGQDVVEVIERLDPRAERAGWLRATLTVTISSPLR